MNRKLPLIAVFVTLFLAYLSFGFVAQSEPAPPSAQTAPAATLADPPLADFQMELIDIAFKAASKMPAQPHIKTRCRLQESIAGVCLQLNQSQRALEYIDQISDWRRGAGYADYAFHRAHRGDTSDVTHYLDLAARNSHDAQDWRRDAVMVKIAKTYALLGQDDRAAGLEAGVVSSEAGKVDAVRMQLIDESEFEARLDALSAVLATADFDRIRNALDACTNLLNRFYDDTARRALVESRIRSPFGTIPAIVKLEVLMTMSAIAVDHHDAARALELVNEAHAIFETQNWAAEDRIPLQARLASLRFRAGDAVRARKELASVQALFDSERERIVDIYRARALRPVAEAWLAMGDAPAAVAAYARAIEESVHNPNSRPRAEDLIATCCSIALLNVEPGPALLDRIRHVAVNLGEPW